MQAKSSYTLLAIIMHWLSAFAVIGLFVLGYWMVDLDYYSKWYQTAPMWHMSIGVLLAFVTVLRLFWRITHPVQSDSGKRWEQISAHVAHWILYVLLFALFLTGYLISTGDGRGIDIFDWFTVPSLGEWFANQKDIAGEWHEWIAYSLIGLAALHALAALKHHFIDKDHTLKKMLKP